MIRCLLNALDAFEKGKISTLGAINDTSCLGIDLPDSRGIRAGEYTWLYNSDSIIHCYVCDSGNGFKMYNPGDLTWYVDTADANMKHGIPRLYFPSNNKDVECAMSRQMTWKERDLDISYFSDALGSMANSHMIVHNGVSGIDYLSGFTLDVIPTTDTKTDFYSAVAAFPWCGAAQINFYVDSPTTGIDFDAEMRRTKQEVYATSLEFTGEGLPEKLEKLAIVRPDVPAKSGEKGKTEPANYRNLVAYLGEKEDAEPDADDDDKYEDAVTICKKDDDDETCEIDFVEGSEKDPDVGDMAYSDIDELKPGFYKPSDYSKFYTKDHYEDEKRKKALAAAKWGVYKQTDLKYQVKCIRKIVREEDKKKDEENSDGSDASSDSDKNDKKTVTKYKYKTEACNIDLAETTYSAINRRLYKTWSSDEYCRIPVRGCSGFAYYIKNVKARDLFGPSFGMITFVPDNTKIETDLVLFPRTTISIVGLVPKELAGKIGGSAPQGYKFLAKVPSIGNNVLSKYADSSSNFGYKWHFSVVVLDVDGSTVKMDGDKGILFKEIASFERNEDGDLETSDGKFRIFGRPDRSSSVYSNSINGKHGEGTTGASLAFSGKRTYTQAKGGIYDVKADKYFCMESANVSIKPDPSSSKTVDVLKKTATLDISGKVHTLQLHFVKRFQSNRMYGMFFMPTLGLIRKMSIDFNNSKDIMAKLKGFSNRLYRLHVWSKFVEAVLAGRYVADTGGVYTFEPDEDGDGGKWKKKDGKYKKFDFGLLTADRPPVYYANILNSDVIDLVAKEVVVAASRLYVKDEEQVPIRKFAIRVSFRDEHGRIEDNTRRLAPSDPEKYEDIGQAACPMFKNYIDTISVADIITIGRSTLGKPHKSTSGVIDLIDARISKLEEIAMLGDERVFVTSLSSVSAKYVTDINSSASFRGYKHRDKHGFLSIKGLSTLPGCFAEIYETPMTVKGLNSYTWEIDMHSIGKSECNAGWYDPGKAPDWCDYVVNIQRPVCESPDDDGNRECETESVDVCVAEGYDDMPLGFCSAEDASKYANGLRWWYGNYAQDYAKNRYKVPTFWNTDNFYRGEIIVENPFTERYLYDQSSNYKTVQIKKDTTKKYVVNVGTVDSSGFNNTTPHTFSAYPGDDSPSRLFSYSETIDGCLSWKYDGNAREFHVPFIARNYTTRRKPEVDFYDITDFISLTKSQKYLGIPDAFAVK